MHHKSLSGIGALILYFVCATQVAGQMAPSVPPAQAPNAQSPPSVHAPPQAVTPLPPVDSVGRARTLVELAHRATGAGEFGLAERLLREAADLEQSGSDTRRDTDAEIQRVLDIEKQLQQLDEAEYLITRQQFKDAQALLDKIVPQAADGLVVERARHLANHIEPSWRDETLDKTSELLVHTLPYAFLILGGLAIAWLSRALGRAGHERWIVAEISDSTGQGAAALISGSFSRWLSQKNESVTSGLLLLEASTIPQLPALSLREDQFDVPKELQSTKLTVGGFDIGAVASLFAVMRRWFVWRREIRGTIYLVDKRVCAHLHATYFEPVDDPTARGRGCRRTPGTERSCVVSAYANSDAPDAIRAVVEEVTFKMLYALSTKQPSAGEHANDLRLGLQSLRKYLSGTEEQGCMPNQTLEEARQRFERVRKADPDSLEAYLYEGVALDLLERHLEAISTFNYVKQLTAPNAQKPNPTLHLRARYNEAVANLRNLYQLQGINSCIEKLDELVVNAQFNTQPLMVLALATKADAIANKTIHWRNVAAATPDIARLPTESEKRHAVITLHIEKVTELINQILDILAHTQGNAWDADTVRQVNWAIANAKADLYLYAAVTLTKIDISAPPDSKSFERVDQTLDFNDYINLAAEALRQCETLLPAGVETLTNAGTLHLVRGEIGDLIEARRLLCRAIALNPQYEYAYYRLAQCWEKDRWREKVIETLQSCPVPPNISSFARMFEYYYVQPKTEYPVVAAN
jgi:tetratricopeptide (TPR) repeat protein